VKRELEVKPEVEKRVSLELLKFELVIDLMTLITCLKVDSRFEQLASFDAET
jgi:hypothetical protein